jgi:hypothetical protein
MVEAIPGAGPEPEAGRARRAAAETEQQRESEFRAVQRDLAVKNAYVQELELELERIEINVRGELAQVRARAAELFGDLERAEAVIADLRDEIAAIRATRSYRWSVAAATFASRLTAPVRRGGPPATRQRRPEAPPGQSRSSQ